MSCRVDAECLKRMIDAWSETVELLDWMREDYDEFFRKATRDILEAVRKCYPMPNKSDLEGVLKYIFDEAKRSLDEFGNTRLFRFYLEDAEEKMRRAVLSLSKCELA